MCIFDMTLWCLEVVVVLARSSSGEISCLKWGNMDVQLITWYGNDENKHDEVTFQLTAADFNSSKLMVWNLCNKHCILKDNSWMCILHQYHKASRLKSCIAMCWERERNGYIYFINSRWRRPLHVFLLGIMLLWKNMK